MKFTSKMYWLHCLSPLHVGAGEGGSYIDNPIMREKVTGWPFVPGSSVKGVLRDEAEKKKLADIDKAFGKASDDGSSAGILAFSDAHLICLPVRSVYGTFAWVTAPIVLKRLQRDWPLLAQHQFDKWDGEENIYPAKPSVLYSEENARKIFLEDLDLNVAQEDKDAATKLATCLAKAIWPKDDVWQKLFQERFTVVSDNVFNFLTKTATQIDTRVRIESNTKTVVPGALWTEEYLPTETILAGVVWQDDRFAEKQDAKKLLDDFCTKEQHLFLGGNITVGRGQIRCRFGG